MSENSWLVVRGSWLVTAEQAVAVKEELVWVRPIERRTAC